MVCPSGFSPILSLFCRSFFASRKQELFVSGFRVSSCDK